MQAIETSYAGCRFRSRIEARWAVFFDHMNIPWRYEEEGVKLDSGKWYLPDFYLPDQDCYLEVKGKVTGQDLDVLDAMGRATGRTVYDTSLTFRERMQTPTPPHVYLLEGNIPSPLNPRYRRDWWIWGPMDCRSRSNGSAIWKACPACGGFAAINPENEPTFAYCNVGDPSHVYSTLDSPFLLTAFAAARSARFEHSERESFRPSEVASLR